MTVGEIARRLDAPLHKVEYQIRARGITPASRAGNARVFDEEAVQRIDAALQAEEEAAASRKARRCQP